MPIIQRCCLHLRNLSASAKKLREVAKKRKEEGRDREYTHTGTMYMVIVFSIKESQEPDLFQLVVQRLVVQR
jgi:hypothetical protein